MRMSANAFRFTVSSVARAILHQANGRRTLSGKAIAKLMKHHFEKQGVAPTKLRNYARYYMRRMLAEGMLVVAKTNRQRVSEYHLARVKAPKTTTPTAPAQRTRSRESLATKPVAQKPTPPFRAPNPRIAALRKIYEGLGDYLRTLEE